MPSPTRVAISCGDPNGVGLEVALRAFADARMFDAFTPVVFASPGLVAAHAEANDLTDVRTEVLDVASLPATRLLRARVDLVDHADPVDTEATVPGAPPAEGEESAPESLQPPTFAPSPRTLYVVDCFGGEEPEVRFGVESEAGGAVAKTSLEHAARALAEGRVEALVTAPIHKSAMQRAGFAYPGHTEFLEAAFAADAGRSLMLMVGEGGLRVAVATNHVPLRGVASSISPTILGNKIDLLARALERDFGIVGPRIAVLGLNPHAGDGGAIGTEEESTIRPAVEAAQERGLDVMGPYPADGFFGAGRYRDFDAVLAMYHDQGLVPFKTLAFGGGVNFTAGLTVVRTSPDHGTALDIAGTGAADAASFLEALFLARDAVRARAGYDADHADPIRVRGKRRERGGRGGGGQRDRGFERGKRGPQKGKGRGGERRDGTPRGKRDGGHGGDAARPTPRTPAPAAEGHDAKSPAAGQADGTGAPTVPAREPDPADPAESADVAPSTAGVPGKSTRDTIQPPAGAPGGS